jgi:hypothetical protein
MAALSAARSSLNAVVPGLPLGDILLGNIGAFKRGFVFEVIDSKTGEALMTKSLVLNPQRYTLTEPFAVTLTPTEDNTVVAEENGIIIREIVIEGTTGLEKRAEEALGRGGSIGTEASGVDHFYQLRDVFREYAILKQDPERAPFIQMLFHNVKEDDHFVVVPRSFETPRDAKSNRFHFNYRISLAAIQSLPPPPPPAEGLFGDILDVIKDVTEFVNDVRANIVEAIDLIEIYRERINNPESFFDEMAIALNSAHDLVDSVSVTVRVGREFFEALGDLVDDIQDDMGNDIDGDPTEDQFRECRRVGAMGSGMAGIQQHSQIFAPPLAADASKEFAGDLNFTKNDLENNLAGASKGTKTRLAKGKGGQQGLNLGSFSGSKRAEVGATDTIDSFANKQGVPREAIIALNNLRFPYITRGGGPGTLKPGDSILVPTRSSGSGNNAGASISDRYLTTDDIIYGVDLALDAELAQVGIFDILVDEVHGSLDAQLVRGKDNAVQGIQILIGTERGSTTFIPDLGIKRTPGVKGTVPNMLLASLYLREAILSDPRIRGIDSSRIVLEGDVLTQEITPQLIDARDGVTVVVPFGKAAQ